MENNLENNLHVSIMSVIVKLLNIVEKSEIELLELVEPNETIVSIYNNYGRKDYKNDYRWLEIIKNDKIKKKNKKNKNTNRILNGIGEFSGTSFNSQTTFVIKETEEMCNKRVNYYKSIKENNIKDDISDPKYFKIKYFINGSIQIPGIIFEDLSDARELLNILIKMLNKVFNNNIIISSIQSSMRNYKIQISNQENKPFDLEKIKQNMSIFKSKDIIPIKNVNNINNINNEIIDDLGINTNNEIIDDLGINNNEENKENIYYLNRIDLNMEKQQGLVIKIYKSNDSEFLNKISNIKLKKYYSEVSIKIFSNRKINIDSVNNIEEAKNILEFIKIYINDSYIDNIINEASEYYSSDEYL